jgi:predicted RNase H-like HicB family nuclease
MTDTSRYPAYIFWSVEDEGFIALAPDLPGCSAFGGTQAEALHQLQGAIAAWRKAAAKACHPIPPPSNPAGAVLARGANHTKRHVFETQAHPPAPW